MSCITKLLKTIKQSITQNKLLKIIICLIGFIVIFILMLMISSFAINWLVNTPNPFGLGFIDESNKDTWINFFGAIIGGITTLAGVWLTIREERKNSLEQQKRLELQRREDLAIQYKPYLELTNPITLRNEDIYYSYSTYNDIFDLNETLYLKNIGRGEAIITSIYVSNQINETDLINIQANLDCDYINKNKSATLNIRIRTTDFEPIFNSKTNNEYTLNIVYSDLLKFYKYTKSIKIKFNTVIYSLSADPIDNVTQETYEIRIQ